MYRVSPRRSGRRALETDVHDLADGRTLGAIGECVLLDEWRRPMAENRGNLSPNLLQLQQTPGARLGPHQLRIYAAAAEHGIHEEELIRYTSCPRR